MTIISLSVRNKLKAFIDEIGVLQNVFIMNLL